MKILVVCQHYKPEPFRISDICETLVRQGHQVKVVTGVPNYPEGDIYPGYEKSWGRETMDNGVRVRRCFLLPKKTGALHRMLNYFSFAGSSTWYLSRMREECDVVFVYQLSPVIMARGALRYGKKHGKKVVLYCLDLWPESLVAGGISRNSCVYRLFFKVSQRIYRSADKILITSRGFDDYFRDCLHIPGVREYLPQYAEELFDAVPEKRCRGDVFHFVFAGNVGEMQSVDTIIRAARLLRDDPRAVIHVVGEGSMLHACRELAGDLPNVIFHGRRTVEEMPRFFAMADVMLVSLKDDPRIAATLPGKVQSYMAAGKPLLGSVGGETAAVIREADCGICCEPENSEALAEAIRHMLERPEKLTEYGRNSRNYYRQHFSKEQFFCKLTEVLRECSRQDGGIL